MKHSIHLTVLASSLFAAGVMQSEEPHQQTNEGIARYTTISLADIAHQPIDWLLTKPTGRVSYEGVPFVFADDPKGWSSDAPTTTTLKVEVVKPASVRILINGGGAGRPEHQGKEIGVIKLGFADGTDFLVPLKPGTILRAETWAYNDEKPQTPPGDDVVKVVNVISEPQSRGRDATAFLDMLVIDLPLAKTATSLTSISLTDTSQESVNDPGPGFVVSAITICSASKAPELRTFTDTKDRKILATLVALKGNDVILKREDGLEFAVKAATLSSADVEYLKSFGFTPMEAANK